MPYTNVKRPFLIYSSAVVIIIQVTQQKFEKNSVIGEPKYVPGIS